jgi:integrase
VKTTYRRFIRIGNRLESSPLFHRKKDAEEWYAQMRRKKQFLRDGLIIPDDEDGIIFIDYCSEWVRGRMKSYPASTWKSDEQRLRDYVLPFLSELPISKITASNIRNLLLSISKEGYLKEGFTISTSTRTRVKALLSAIFSDALNEDPPLVPANPVLGIRIKEKRTGQKKPRVLSDKDECLKFLSAAESLGWDHYVLASTFLMSGIRKQELIALKWSSIDFKNKKIIVTEKYEQASNSIKKGTKRGLHITREIPVSTELLRILKDHRSKSNFKKETDFVLCEKTGKHLLLNTIRSMISETRKEAHVDISAHGLRHTFGREFAANTGNIKALQAILGHTSSVTTDIYSDLAGNRLKKFSESVSFSVNERNK